MQRACHLATDEGTGATHRSEELPPRRDRITRSGAFHPGGPFDAEEPPRAGLPRVRAPKGNVVELYKPIDQDVMPRSMRGMGIFLVLIPGLGIACLLGLAGALL